MRLWCWKKIKVLLNFFQKIARCRSRALARSSQRAKYLIVRRLGEVWNPFVRERGSKSCRNNESFPEKFPVGSFRQIEFCLLDFRTKEIELLCVENHPPDNFRG